MSTSYRRLQVEVAGHVSGFMAAMNQVMSGTTRVGQGFRQGSRDAGLFEKQILAIGTTARYALAGQLVFGITASISKLADFKAELGTIDSLAGSIDKNQNFRSLGGQLDEVGTQAVLMSNKFGIAVGDVESYMQRFFSSFDVSKMGVKGRISAMDAFVGRVGQLQAMMGAEAGDPQALAGGIAGFIQQVPKYRRNIPRGTKDVANLVAFLTRETPNITGRNISTDIGRIGASMKIANMTPEQVFAVWGLAGKAGGSASVIGRGITQLLGSSLLNPKTPQQIAAYQGAGLPTDPSTLRSMGGMQILARMLQYVGKSGVRIKNPRALTDESLGDPEALAAAGVSNVNLTGIYHLLGRQESVRQFVQLLGQGGVKALQAYIKHQNQAIKVDQQRQRYEAAASQRVLTRVTQARSNLGMTLVAGASWPLEHLYADPVIGLSNLAARHRTSTQLAMGGALGYGAVRMLKRVISSRKAGGLVGGAISAEELPNVIQGGATDGTRANPFWVIISPLSWSVGSPGGFSSPVPSGDKTRLPSIFGKIPKGTALRGGVAAAVAVGLAADSYLLYQGLSARAPNVVGRGRFSNLVQSGGHFFNAMPGGGRLTPATEDPALQAALAAAHIRAQDVQQIQVTGKAKMDVDVNVHHPDGSVTRVHKRGVPVQLIPAKQFPTSGGKPRKKGGR